MEILATIGMRTIIFNEVSLFFNSKKGKIQQTAALSFWRTLKNFNIVHLYGQIFLYPDES
jgi:hypothetical protein